MFLGIELSKIWREISQNPRHLSMFFSSIYTSHVLFNSEADND